MAHDPHQPKRTERTQLKRVPLQRKMDPMHQRLLLAAGVGLSMLVILGLYAASFRYQRALSDDTSVLPRWGVVKDEVTRAFKPIQEQADAIGNVKASFDAIMGAKVTQAESIAILKAKLESATATPETN